MRFLFIDESEKQKNRYQRYFFSLCGLMVDEENLISLNNELNKIKEEYGFSNLKELRGGISREIKLEVTHKVFQILSSNDAEVITAILGDIALKYVTTVNNVYFDALTFLIERFFIHLSKENKRGIIIFDSVDKSLENKLRNKFYDYISTQPLVMYSKRKGYFREKIFPSIFFSDDEHTTILQATDLIATSLNSAVWTALQDNGKKFSVEKLHERNEYLRIYWPLFVKSPKGRVNGWGIKIWW